MNEDTLILYYYNDGLSNRERRQVEAAINADATVAAQYKALCLQLNDLYETDDQEVPAHTLRRWHDTIDHAAQQQRVRQQKPASSFNLFSFAWGAAITATLAIGIGISMYIAGGDTNSPAPIFEVASVDSGASIAVPAAFTRSVKAHLQDTRQGLADLSLDADADRIMLILRIIHQNRLFERTAVQNNSQSLARVLRAFEPILLRLAADDIAPEDAEALRAQLAFELNVMLTKLSRNTSNKTQST